MFDWTSLKDILFILITAIAGYIGFKARQADISKTRHESQQDKKISILEMRMHKVEKKSVIVSERARSIQNEISDLKEEIREDFKDIKADLKILIHEKRKS